MKVKHLIEKLKRFDPEMIVCLETEADEPLKPISDIRQETACKPSCYGQEATEIEVLVLDWIIFKQN